MIKENRAKFLIMSPSSARFTAGIQGTHRHQSTFRRVRTRGGGGYLLYLSDGDVPFFRVSFLPISSRTGYQRKANFLEQVVKTCQKRKFCYNGLLFSQIFVFFGILFTDFF